MWLWPEDPWNGLFRMHFSYGWVSNWCLTTEDPDTFTAFKMYFTPPQFRLIKSQSHSIGIARITGLTKVTPGSIAIHCSRQVINYFLTVLWIDVYSFRSGLDFPRHPFSLDGIASLTPNDLQLFLEPSDDTEEQEHVNDLLDGGIGSYLPFCHRPRLIFATGRFPKHIASQTFTCEEQSSRKNQRETFGPSGPLDWRCWSGEAGILNVICTLLINAYV